MITFKRAFRPDVCIGDSLETEINGKLYRAVLEFDSDTRPDDYDCYDQDAIDSWKRDEWKFGCILFFADGLCVDSLGGVEIHATAECAEYLTSIANDMLLSACNT